MTRPINTPTTMTTTPNPPDWRGLCEELIALVERCPVTSDTDWIADRNDLIVRFHAAKRNGLPQPELEVVGPTLEQVSDWITKCSQNPEENKWTRRVDHHDALAIAKAALHDWGRPAPVQPAEGEVGELVRRLRYAKQNGNWILSGIHWELDDGTEHQGIIYVGSTHANDCARAADLLEQRHPAPVPVSERLPEPGTKVLAHYFNALGKGRTICAIWVPAKSRIDEGDLVVDDFLEYDEDGDKYYWSEGWYEAIESCEELGWVKVYEGEVVYWQPLPKWPAHALPYTKEQNVFIQ